MCVRVLQSYNLFYILNYCLLSIVLRSSTATCTLFCTNTRNKINEIMFVILIFLLYHGTGVPMFIIIYCLYTILFKLPRQRPHL